MVPVYPSQSNSFPSDLSVAAPGTIMFLSNPFLSSDCHRNQAWVSEASLCVTMRGVHEEDCNPGHEDTAF